jgi:hypothetical protein
MSIYILKLSGGKYYIGKSTNVNKRYEQHLAGKVSWTAKYKPESIVSIIENPSPFDEDKITKEYMNMHGIDNVRGGSYSLVNLSDSQKDHLQKEIWGANGLCLRCGRGSHFINDCYAKYDSHGNQLNYTTRIICFACGKEGHYAYDCSFSESESEFSENSEVSEYYSE